MMITELVCDRCGMKNNEDAVKSVTVVTPQGGINGGEYKPDLCLACRTALNDLVHKFLSTPEEMTTAPDKEKARKRRNRLYLRKDDIIEKMTEALREALMNCLSV